MSLIDVWNLVSAVLATLGGAVLTVLGIGALFAMDWPRRAIPRIPDGRELTRRPLSWTCTAQPRAMNTEEARRVLRVHRGHGCVRERDAAAVLTAAARAANRSQRARNRHGDKVVRHRYTNGRGPHLR